MSLLRYMFHAGNPIDIAWFLVGAWLLIVFLFIFFRQVLRGKKHEPGWRDPEK